MDNFFGPLQNNVLDRQSWSSREELRLAVVPWTERTYLPPAPSAERVGSVDSIEHETTMTSPAVLAA